MGLMTMSVKRLLRLSVTCQVCCQPGGSCYRLSKVWGDCSHANHLFAPRHQTSLAQASSINKKRNSAWSERLLATHCALLRFIHHKDAWHLAVLMPLRAFRSFRLGSIFCWRVWEGSAVGSTAEPCDCLWSSPGFVDTSELVKEAWKMSKTRPLYPPEFRCQMVELVRAGRNPEELAREFEPSAQTIRD